MLSSAPFSFILLLNYFQEKAYAHQIYCISISLATTASRYYTLQDIVTFQDIYTQNIDFKALRPWLNLIVHFCGFGSYTGTSKEKYTIRKNSLEKQIMSWQKITSTFSIKFTDISFDHKTV